MPNKDDILDRMKGGGKKKSESSSSSSSSETSRDSPGSAEPYSLSDEEKMMPEDVDLHDASENIAGGAELNYGKGTSSLSGYKKRQISEVKELHEDMFRTAKQHGDAVDTFILVLQAMIMSYAQNRVGIAMTIMSEFGKSKKEALKITNQICRKAGEPQTFEKIVSMLTEEFID